jgi:CheY-like chemotaxis protein
MQMSDPGTDRRRTSRPQVIVVAEDADALRELWEIWLSHHGFEVIAARTGAEALTVATEHHPVAVIMDWAMPVMDGLEATRRLKQDPRTADVPIVMVTAHTSAYHRRAAESAGCAAFVGKPVDPHQLMTELRRVLAGV